MPQSTLTDAQRDALLTSVTTVAEAAAQYGISYSVIQQAIRYGWITARHSGRVWLLLTADCDRRWGYRLTLEGVSAHE